MKKSKSSVYLASERPEMSPGTLAVAFSVSSSRREPAPHRRSSPFSAAPSPATPRTVPTSSPRRTGSSSGVAASSRNHVRTVVSREVESSANGRAGWETKQ